MFSDELYNDRALCCVSSCHQCSALPLTLWELLGFKDLNISAWRWMPIIAALRRLRQEECDWSQPEFLLKRGWEGGESKACSGCLRWSSWGGSAQNWWAAGGHGDSSRNEAECGPLFPSPEKEFGSDVREKRAWQWRQVHMVWVGGHCHWLVTGLTSQFYSLCLPKKLLVFQDTIKHTLPLWDIKKWCRLQQMSSLVSSVFSCPDSSLLKSPRWSLWKATL